MSKLLPLLLLCLAANAFAQTAVDSGRCPWKLPFTLDVGGGGLRHYFGETVPTHGPGTNWDSGYSAYSTSLNISVDSSLIKANPPYLTKVSGGYSVQNNTLHFTQSYNNMGVKFTESVTIVFAGRKDSLASIVADKNVQYPDSITYPGYSRKENSHFEIRGLKFTDSSIFSDDSTLTRHSIVMTTSSVENYNPEGIPGFGSFTSSNFSAISVYLSGIFRPTHFSDQTSGVTVAREPKPLRITRLNGKLECSFSSSQEARTLELYSLVGAKVLVSNIQPGATEAALPKLANGFYVLRLGSETQKIYLDE